MNFYQNTVAKPFYRKDIDGLRCIAIVMVVAYHLGLHLFSSGFIGVDVFFVISGFLITSHIVKELENNAFSLTQFYLKRMRRIFPAFLCVVLVTTVAAYILLRPKELATFRMQLPVTLLYMKNILLWAQSKNYFSPNTQTQPLLNMWSLGVEEQFYLLWPLFLLLLFKYIPKVGILIVVILSAITSFALYYYYRKYPILVFYMPYTRGYELFIGAALGVYVKQIAIVRYMLVKHALSLLGLFLIIYAGLVLQPSAYPGWASLLPCLGVALLIMTGADKFGVGNKLISNRLFVFIGLISYSIYLWHWPIIAFCHYFHITIDPSMAIIIIVTTMILSYMTWYWIEQPFRFKYKFDFQASFLCLFFIPFFFGTYVTVLNKEGYNNYTIKLKPGYFQIYAPWITEKYQCFEHMTPGLSYTLPASIDQCWFGSQAKKSIDILLLGDSHAFHAMGMLHALAVDQSLKGVVIAKYINSSEWFQNSHLYLLFNNKHNKLQSSIKKYILKNSIKYVVFGGFWSHYPQKQNLKSGLKNAVVFLIKHHVTPVIIVDTPIMLDVNQMCGLSKISNNKNCFIDLKDRTNNSMAVIKIIRQLKKDNPSIILLNPSKLICDASRCYSKLNNIPIYANTGWDSHLNFIASQLIGKQIIVRYGNPFVKK